MYRGEDILHQPLTGSNPVLRTAGNSGYCKLLVKVPLVKRGKATPGQARVSVVVARPVFKRLEIMNRNLGQQLLYEYDTYHCHVKVWLDLFTLQTYHTEHPLR